MTDREKLLDNYLLNIAENLDISATMREKAERSYRTVGEWLGDCDTTSDVKIMPQGSFYLGTVIRPVSDADGSRIYAANRERFVYGCSGIS